MSLKINTHYGKHKRLQFNTTGPSLTHQSMQAECDINKIMLRWQKTGVIEHQNKFEGRYENFLDTPQDYQESMNAVLAADEMFQTLPSSIRRRFHNDPGTFLDFVGNPENAEEMIKMGLATKAQKDEVLEPLIETPKAPPAPPKEPVKAKKSAPAE